MRMGSILSGAALAVVIAGTIPAAADVLLPVSYYNMNNGAGTGAKGDFQYWDATYGGFLASPATQAARITDNAFLQGSTGVLTNGFIAVDRWDYYATKSGTGQYVGWNTMVYGDPSILFHLSGNTDVHSISFYVDNSYVGLVGGPISIDINSTLYNSSSAGWTMTALTPNPGDAGGAEKITISGLNIKAEDINVTLNAGPYGSDALAYTFSDLHGGKEPWIMLSEVQFNGVTVANGVPELSTWAMMLIGFTAIGYAAYRRRNNTTVGASV
jgi:hypothetical protein